jgi:hypothetical protein
LAVGVAATAIAGQQTRRITNTSLIGSNLTAWDASQDDTDFTPAYDGATYEGGYYHYDAFDDGLVLTVNGSTFLDPDEETTVKDNGYTVGPHEVDGLKIRQHEWASGPFLRTLIELKNPTNSAVNTVAEIDNDLGSDGSEEIIDSSSGSPTAYEAEDRWVISSQDNPPAAYNDPALTLVTHGKRADEPANTDTGFVGSGHFDYDYEFNVPGDKSRYLLLFTEMHGLLGKAKKDAEKYDDGSLSASLLKGIDDSALKSVVNWDLG